MMKKTVSVAVSVVLAAALATSVVGCSSTPGHGAESAGANAGRVVDDSLITGKVKAALVADPDTKAHQIEVETFKGTVQLSGFVDSTTARRRAVEVARNIEGVKDVKNSLQIRNPS